MAGRRERQIVHFDIGLNTNPPGEPVPIDEVAEALIERVVANQSIRLVEADRHLLGIAKAKIITRADGMPALALLFHFADPDAADPANIHMYTRAIRRFDKQEGEARGVSAHAVLDMTPRQPRGHVHRVLVETVEHLGKTRVRAALASDLRQVFKDKEMRIRNVDGQEVAAKPVVDLSVVASDRLKNSILSGTLRGIKLVDAKSVDGGFDAPESVQVRRREMSLKVDVPIGSTIVNMLERIRPWAREKGFDELYVEWVPRLEAGEGDAMTAVSPERAKINLAHEDIGETLFAKREFVSLDADISDLCDELNGDLLNAMIALLP